MRGMGMKKKMGMAGGGMMKKGYAGGGMMKKGYKAGGMPMATDPKTGKKVPAFAVDGKGKMKGGGKVKKGYQAGGMAQTLNSRERMQMEKMQTPGRTMMGSGIMQMESKGRDPRRGSPEAVRRAKERMKGMPAESFGSKMPPEPDFKMRQMDRMPPKRGVLAAKAGGMMKKGYAAGGMAKKGAASGGKSSSNASKRADGIASRGKTKGVMK